MPTATHLHRPASTWWTRTCYPCRPPSNRWPHWWTRSWPHPLPVDGDWRNNERTGPSCGATCILSSRGPFKRPSSLFGLVFFICCFVLMLLCFVYYVLVVSIGKATAILSPWISLYPGTFHYFPNEHMWMVRWSVKVGWSIKVGWSVSWCLNVQGLKHHNNVSGALCPDQFRSIQYGTGRSMECDSITSYRYYLYHTWYASTIFTREYW